MTRTTIAIRIQNCLEWIIGDLKDRKRELLV